MNNKIIFWDMDETLGFFRHFADYEKLEEVPKNLASKNLLKNGIEELLQELSADGFTHYITTSGIEEYAQIALNATGIRKYFNNVYARKKLCPELGFGYYGDKDYTVPLKDMGISIERAKSDVLIIGNSKSDVPFNIKEIVSIIDTMNWQHRAELTKKLIYILTDKGSGDFNQGFHKLYSESKKIGPWAKHLSDRGKISLEEGTILRLEFMEEREKCSQAPILIVSKAGKYESRE